MTLIYYNSKANAIFVIESDDGASMSMYFVLTIAKKNVRNGWIYLGEL